ncbi:MAG: NUDIX hydrolase [Saprospiraceae bacterium]|nr:NUDIX hydrolase [Saprospiraceae bacterium]
MEQSDWKTLGKSIIYENPWIRVEHRDVINPSGNPGIYGTVHYKNIAIAVLPIDEEGYTYLVGQYRYVLSSYSWEIPEGGCPEEEDPLTAARRELKEETGLEAEDWTPILEMDLSNSVSDEHSISYIARGLTNGHAKPDETENLQVRKVHFNDLLQMVLNNEIRDALTIGTVLRAYLLFNS